ncbi:MAG: hypothetical protein PVI23_15675 [Maricaulaceae bacterium]|jgi:preprotein translocase subunit SecD
MLYLAPWKTALAAATCAGALAALGGCDAGREERATIRLIYEVQFDDRRLAGELTEQELAEARAEERADIIEILSRRADAAGVDPVTLAPVEDDRILVELRSVDELSKFRAIAGSPAQLTIQLVAYQEQLRVNDYVSGAVEVPSTLEVLPTREPNEPYLVVERNLRADDAAVGAGGAPVQRLSGELLRMASAGRHPQMGSPVVNFEFNAVGAEIFSNLTTNHLGERIAVVIDGLVVTAPVVRSPITGGSGFIEGDFTAEEASNLADMLNAGALPSPLMLIEQATVDNGPVDGRQASNENTD